MNESQGNMFSRLMAVIEQRRDAPPERSYTAALLAGGVDRIGQKVLEEAAEVVDAARESGAEGQRHLVREAADLVYHLLVLLAFRRVGLHDVESELARRFGVSGLEEKAARLRGSPPS